MGVAHAEDDHHGTRPLTFDEAIGLGSAGPATAASRAELETRRELDDDIGGTLGATSINLMPGAAFEPEAERGFDFQASVTQSWSLGGLGGARRSAAANEREALGARLRAQALQARLDAASSWVELAVQETLVEHWRRSQSEAEGWLAHARAGFEAREITAAEMSEAEAASADAADRLLAAEGARLVARNRLALAVGHDPRGDVLVTTGALPHPVLPGPDALHGLLQEIGAMPSITLVRLEEAAAHAREVEARAEAAPVLSFGAQLERSASDTWVGYGIVGLSFGVTDRGQRGAALQGGERARQSGELAWETAKARSELELAAHEVEHSGEQLRLRADRSVPALERLVDGWSRAVALREALPAELYRARRRLQDARAEVVRARGEHAWARVRLWLLLAQLNPAGGP